MEGRTCQRGSSTDAASTKATAAGLGRTIVVHEGARRDRVQHHQKIGLEGASLFMQDQGFGLAQRPLRERRRGRKLEAGQLRLMSTPRALPRVPFAPPSGLMSRRTRRVPPRLGRDSREPGGRRRPARVPVRCRECPRTTSTRGDPLPIVKASTGRPSRLAPMVDHATSPSTPRTDGRCRTASHPVGEGEHQSERDTCKRRDHGERFHAIRRSVDPGIG
jgi:hypothetical protein